MLEKMYKKEWRKNWRAPEEKVLSQLWIVATYVQAKINESGRRVQDVLNELDNEACKAGVTSLYALEEFINEKRKKEGNVKGWARTVRV